MKGYSKRLDRIHEYYFSQKTKEVNRLSTAGKPIINMGIGSPDLPPHASVIAAINRSVLQPGNHGYQGYQGIPVLRKAFADFYRRHYEVALDPDEEILPLMGSKEGIMHISMTFLNDGDQVLIPDPGYPTYTSVTKMLHAEPVYYALNEGNSYYPDFTEIEKSDLSKVKIMWVNYPHMPSGTKATPAVFEQLIAFGQKHDILIVHDNPYSFILEDYPKSIFQTPGAKETALELNSLSKTANMAGWRVGVVAGHRDWIKAVTKVKSNMDSGMFLGIQVGAVAALELEADWFKALNAVYVKRRELIWKLVEKLGMTCRKDTAGMFVWARITSGETSDEVVDHLLYQKHIFITPGHIFGKQGEGYVRISLCIEEAKIEEAISRC